MKDDKKIPSLDQQILAVKDLRIELLEEELLAYKKLNNADESPLSLNEQTGDVFNRKAHIGSVSRGTQPFYLLRFLITAYPERLSYEAIAKGITSINSKRDYKEGAAQFCADLKRELKKQCPDAAKHIDSRNGMLLKD